MPCRRGRASPSLGAWRGQPRSNRPPTPSRLAPHPAIYNRWVEPRTPSPSLKWRSGSKPWLRPTLPHHIHHPLYSRRLHHNAANNPTHSHPHLYYLPHLIHHPYHFLRLHHNIAAAPACLQALLSSTSAPTTALPVYSPAPADLNLDGAWKPLSFYSAIRGPHGKEWTLADEQELIKLLVTLKCLRPVMRNAKIPTYLKRVVKEKWDEVNRLRKRRVRWTIGGDRIEIDYEVGTNTAALPTVNALFHSIVSTHSFLATIDIVDYYLGALLPSPESVRIDSLNSVFFPSSALPRQTLPVL
jgi:hypothetical protein